MCVSDSKGFVSLLQFDDSGSIRKVSSVKGHRFESWTAAFDYWNPSIVYSGKLTVIGPSEVLGPTVKSILCSFVCVCLDRPWVGRYFKISGGIFVYCFCSLEIFTLECIIPMLGGLT